MEQIGTGIEYPTLELGGRTYVVKFTRGGLMYRLNRSGASFQDLGGTRSFATYIDILHAAFFGQYDGTAEDLADLVIVEGKFATVCEAINDAIKKVFPPTQQVADGTAGQQTAVN